MFIEVTNNETNVKYMLNVDHIYDIIDYNKDSFYQSTAINYTGGSINIKETYQQVKDAINKILANQGNFK